MNYRKIFAFLVLLTFISSCEDDFTFTPAVEEEDPTVIDNDTPSNDLATAYQTLLDEVNDLRAAGCRCGNEEMPPVGPVTWNARIASAAQRHTLDMVNNDHFDHAGTDGSNAGQRLTAAGYEWFTYGENIAFGYNSATAVFNGWKNSPGHCRNMMNANFREMGAAESGRYWTQDFGATR